MSRQRNLWKRADIRLRVSCRKLTERQRAAVLLALFLPFLAGCVYTVGTALQGFGKRAGPGPEAEHIRPADITFGTKINSKEQAKNRHENEHRKTQDAAEAASAQGRRQAAD